MQWKKMAALGLVGLLGAAGIGYAYQGVPGTPGPNCTVDKNVQAELQAAIESGDYATFQQIRDEKAVISGDVDRAMEIREELGLPLGGGYGYAHASGPRDGTGKRHMGIGSHRSGPRDGTGNRWGGK